MKQPTKHSSKTVFANQWLELKEDTLSLDKDTEYAYSYLVRRHDGVMVIPYFTDTDSVLMVSQYRHPIRKTIWGFPGGGREKEQSFEDCARQELREETGYQAEELIDLGPYMPDAGMLGNTGRIFVAVNPTKVGEPSQHTAEETTQPEIFTLEKVKTMIADGEIRDGWSLGPFSLFLLWLEKHDTKNAGHGATS